jgi:multiple sugar transport system ATP-binding protein
MAEELLLTAPMSEVRLRGVSKRFDGVSRAALDSLNLTIPGGELAVLVGPSGCGKSTTLRIVAGLEQPTSGRVFIDDRDVTDVPPAERDIAMVFQSYALYPHMTVFDNLAFALRIRKQPEHQIKERVRAVARSLDIESYLERRPKALSGGQRQRVAIGRAVVREPKVFLFDEPLSNLDAKLRGEMRREIARIHNLSEETSSLYVTHDQIEAMTLADRIVVLKDGVMQQVGTPMEIYESPANQFVAGFFGTPAMNFLRAKVASSGDALAAKGEGFEFPLPQRLSQHSDLVVGIRPEAISLQEDSGADPYRGGGNTRHPITAEVELREVLGSEVLLHMKSTAGGLTVKADARSPAREGENLTVWLAPDKLHLFDAESGQRL